MIKNFSKSIIIFFYFTKRDRNREHAKRSRLRKKSMLKSLQASLEALQRQNSKLRSAIKENVENSDQLISNYFLEANRKILMEESPDSLVRAQHNFLTRVNSDLELITTLLN